MKERGRGLGGKGGRETEKALSRRFPFSEEGKRIGRRRPGQEMEGRGGMGRTRVRSEGAGGLGRRENGKGRENGN